MGEVGIAVGGGKRVSDGRRYRWLFLVFSMEYGVWSMECTLERCLPIFILRTEISLIPLGGAGLFKADS